MELRLMQNRIRSLPVTGCDGIQVVMGTNRLAGTLGQRRCQKLVLTVLTCDYLTTLFISATASTIKTYVLLLLALLASPVSHA